MRNVSIAFIASILFLTTSVQADEACPATDTADHGHFLEMKLKSEEPMATAGTLRLFFKLLKTFDPNQPTLVVIDGGPGGDYRLIHDFAPLRDRVNLVSFDHRGVGCTKILSETFPTYEPGLYGTDRAADDIEALRRELLGEDGAIYLYGVSYGGILAQKYAIKYPARVRGLILDSTTFDISYVRIAMGQFRSLFVDEDPAVQAKFATAVQRYPDAETHLLRRFSRAAYRYRDRVVRIPALLDAVLAAPDAESARRVYLSPPDSPLEGMARQIDCEELFDNDAGPYPDFFTIFPQQCPFMAPFKKPIRNGPALAALATPALILAGGHDPVTPVQLSREMHTLIRNSVLYENQAAAHGLLHEKPDCAYELIGRFVDGSSPEELERLASGVSCQSPPELLMEKAPTSENLKWRWL